MPEQNYTLKVTRTETNEIWVSLNERKKVLEAEWLAMQPVKGDDPKVTEMAKELDTLANLLMRIG